MTRDAARSRKAADNRPESRRLEGFAATAAALALALGLAPAVVSEAAAQSRSGIFINNDVLNSLGPGLDPAPLAPLAPAAPPTPLSPRSQPDYQAPVTAPAAPMAGPAVGTQGLGFQPYGDGGFVVTRPGTLLFPPLQAPTSRLTSGFAGDADNHAARARALDNAFAEGPEPSSQLLIPLEGTPAGNDSVTVFMNALPPADPNADPADAPTLVLRRPPQPAPRKPAVPPEAVAVLQQPDADEAPADLAPEFAAPELAVPELAAPELAAPETPVVADLPPEAPAETIAEPAAATPGVDETPAPTEAEAGAMMEVAAEPLATPVATPVAVPVAPSAAQPVSEAALPAIPERAAPATAEAPVSLLPAGPAMTAPGTRGVVQTASLAVGGIEDTSLLFDIDSTDLSVEAQSELRSLAAALRSDAGGDIQVLGFASGEHGAEDQARKLALSRALKVRSFLIDQGIASARIRVRSLGDRAEGGPANRVDIKPIGS